MSTYPPTYSSAFAPHQQQQQQPSQQPHQRPYVMPQPSSWAQPPPFAGAPPIPPGVSVNPQQWQAGVWQINPAYKQNRNTQQQQQQPQQHVPWIPSHHWMPPPAQAHQSQPPSSGQSSQSSQQASFNPYKRQHRAPSAEYLATKLSDNPLGLSNLTPATVEEYYRQGHQTPWIWQPRELSDDSDSTYSKKRNATDPTSNGSAYSQSRRHSEGDVDQEPEVFTSKIDLQPTFSSKIVRTPDHYRNDSTHTPSPTSHRGSRSSIDSQLSSRMAGLSTGSSSNTSPALSRHSTMPLSSSSSFSSFYSSSPTKPDFPPAPMLTDHLSDEPDSMLSPLILAKTPMPGPASNLRSVRNHHPNPLLATQSLDTISEAPSAPNSQFSNTTATGTHTPQQQPQPQGGTSSYHPSFQHANTMPNLPKTQLSYPPQMPVFPPPLIPKNIEREAARDRERERERDHRERADRERERERDWERLGTRHTTYVDPHVSSAATTPSPRSRGPSRSSSRPSSRQSSAQASPVHASNTTPPTYPTYPISSPPGPSNPYSQPSGLTSPTNGYHSGPPITSPTYPSKLSNPLPNPPQMSARIPIPPGEVPNANHNYSHSQSSKANRIPLVLPVQRTPPAHYRDRRRHGYWNQRGDHLTHNGYIVYAPPDRTFPDDLKAYPLVTEGYQDHNRNFVQYLGRPELPQSLPRYGQPPEIPYDAFVTWEYII